MLPSKLGAKDEEEDGKPAIMVAVGKAKMPPKLGAEEEEAGDTSEEALDPKQAMLDASKEIITCLNGSPSVAKRLNAALEAHHRALCELIEGEESE